MKARLTEKWLRLAVAGVLVAGAAGLVACSDDDDDAADPTAAATRAATPAASADEKAVEQVMLDAFAKWNANDIDGFVSYLTDDGLISSFGQGATTVAEARANLQGILGTVKLGTPSFMNTNVTGETATMDNTFSVGNVLTRSKFGLVKVGAAWKLNNEEANLPVEAPAGILTFEVDLNEFAFATDTSAIAGATGAFALEAKNVGAQPHMLGLARIPAAANLEEIFQQENPEGVEFIAGGEDIAPGASSTIVFISPLDAGRYVMVCFLPDTTEGPEGTPHFAKGMVKEFTVE